jgi:hypothetical protein
MLTNCEIVWNEQIPEDTLIFEVPKTSFWLECTKWKNGNWRATLIQPEGTYRKEVWHSIPEPDLSRILETICINARKTSYKKQTKQKLVTYLRGFRAKKPKI